MKHLLALSSTAPLLRNCLPELVEGEVGGEANTSMIFTDVVG